MPWVKALHVMFVVAWFAGLLYLPRLFVYHADTQDAPGNTRFCVMERRLYALMSLAGAGAVLFGAWTLWLEPGLAALAWMRLKLLLVGGLIGYHLWCGRLVRAFAQGRNPHAARWYRLFNEAPTLFLAAIVLLVIVRPF
jgi:protoporphyrinogen IX oxidase